jgi:hypothetical protein
MVVAEWPTSMAPADLAISERMRQDQAFPSPTPIPEVNGTSSDDCCGTLSADGLTLIFASNRVTGALRLYQAHRRDRTAAFDSPVLVGNQPMPDKDSTDPVLSRDGLELIFSSDSGTSVDLYSMTRSCLD